MVPGENSTSSLKDLAHLLHGLTNLLLSDVLHCLKCFRKYKPSVLLS